MKKLFFVCLLVLMLPLLSINHAWAQWNQGGFNYTSDRLAIGTNLSSSKRLYVTGNEADHVALFENTNSTSGYGLHLRAANDPIRVVPFNLVGQHLFVVQGNGMVGIGTSNPQNKLDINGSGTVGLNVFGNNATFVGADINISRISTATGVGQGATLQFNDIGSASYNLIQNSTGGLQFFNNYNNAGWVERMRVAGNGNVGIGTTNPDAKLAVKGIVHAEEVKVDLQVPGPDYVFEPTYQLPSLTEIENYIKTNKHLPEVPSAKEMEANGINLSEMNMLLLKKVEELTLHLIEQKKENEMQGNALRELQIEMRTLKSKIK